MALTEWNRKRNKTSHGIAGARSGSIQPVDVTNRSSAESGSTSKHDIPSDMSESVYPIGGYDIDGLLLFWLEKCGCGFASETRHTEIAKRVNGRSLPAEVPKDKGGANHNERAACDHVSPANKKHLIGMKQYVVYHLHVRMYVYMYIVSRVFAF